MSLKLRSSSLVWTTLRWDIANAACGSIFVLCSGTSLQMCGKTLVFYIYHIRWPVMPKLRRRDNKRMQFTPWLWLLSCSSRLLCSFPSSGVTSNLPYFLLCKFKNSREQKKLLLAVPGSQHNLWATAMYRYWVCAKAIRSARTKILLYCQQCRSFIYTVTVPVHVSHSCYEQNSSCICAEWMQNI